MVAAPETGNVSDRDIFGAFSSKRLLEFGLQFRPAAQVATHVRANLHLSSRRWREVKVRIETGYGVDLTDGYIDLRSELLQLIRRQVTKLLLDRPELVKQGARVPLGPDDRGGDLKGILPFCSAPGNTDLGTLPHDRTCTDVLALYQTVN
jgi:hypothetical protein